MKVFIGTNGKPIGWVKYKDKKLVYSNKNAMELVKKYGLKNIFRKNPYYDINQDAETQRNYLDPRNRFIVDATLGTK